MKLLQTDLSTQQLHFKPGGTPADFNITVSNHSLDYATVQMKLIASGVDPRAGNGWYRLAPEVSALIPGGDRTRFCVSVVDVPPVTGGFTGTMTLTIEVFALESGESDRQVLNLVVEGTGVIPVRVEVPQRQVQGYPGDAVQVPVIVSNPNRHSANVTLQLVGLDPAWVSDGGERRLQLPPNGQIETSLVCQLPDPTQVPSGTYPFTVEALQPQAAPIPVEAMLTVLPFGYVDFRSTPAYQRIPTAGRNKKSKGNTAIFLLEFDNQSNLNQQIDVEIIYEDLPLLMRVMSGGDRLKAHAALVEHTIAMTPERAVMAVGETAQLQLTVQRDRPWWGWARRIGLQARATAIDNRLDIRNDTQLLKLQVLPIMPVWAQLLALLLLMLLIWLPGRLYGHWQPVNSVQINGIATEVVSASDDQTIRRWQVDGNRVKSLGVIAQADKAVRVVRYRPVNNDLIATGYENGQIQIWNLLTGKRMASFVNAQDDRVFDLRFSRDSRTLYSGHGSGAVLGWNVEPHAAGTASGQPQSQQQVGFAVASLALVGEDEGHLAIAGRFNKLMLWDVQQNTLTELPYQPGGRDDYIFSLAIASDYPSLMAVSDNQGTISLWNLERCLAEDTPCTLLDQWSTGHGGEPVHAVALSADACFLASAGGDGRVLLWTLDNSTHQVFGSPKVLERSNQPINSVDLVRLNGTLRVTSGGDNHRVRVYEVRANHPRCG